MQHNVINSKFLFFPFRFMFIARERNVAVGGVSQTVIEMTAAGKVLLFASLSVKKNLVPRPTTVYSTVLKKAECVS